MFKSSCIVKTLVIVFIFSFVLHSGNKRGKYYFTYSKVTSWLPTKTTCVSLFNNYVLTVSINAITLDGGLVYPNKFQFLVSFEIHKYLF